MEKRFELTIVTPDRNFFHGEIDMLITRTTEGDMGVLCDHESFVAPLSIGLLKLKVDDKTSVAACSGGFINIEENKVVIVTDSAEWAHEIDVNRAKSAQARAEDRLKDQGKEMDVQRAKAALLRSMNRVTVHENHISHDRL
jgi:F-type H+-transporting ATPase subunit epsilon